MTAIYILRITLCERISWGTEVCGWHKHVLFFFFFFWEMHLQGLCIKRWEGTALQEDVPGDQASEAAWMQWWEVQ